MRELCRSSTTKPYGLHEMVTKKRPAAFTSYIGGIGKPSRHGRRE
jgi:hypothetical protein